MTLLQILIAVPAVLVTVGALFVLWRLVSSPKAAPARPWDEMPAEPATQPAPAARVVQLVEPDADSKAANPKQILNSLYALAFDDAELNSRDAMARAGQAEVVAASVALLARIENQPRYAPRRPQLLPQLMKAIDTGEASVNALARLIAQDPALAANLLRMANGPLYRAQKGPVENIERATALIGTDGIRSLAAAAMLQPVLESGTGVFGKFPEIIWEHTLYSAAAAEAHAALIENADPFAAQMLGLLQGLGSIIVVRVVRDEYAARPHVVPDAGVAAALLEAWAGSTARRIAESWGLSDRFVDALHDQLLETTPEQLSPLGRSLRFGRVAGALLMLSLRGKLDARRAFRTLVADEQHDVQIRRIWEHLQRNQKAG